MTFAEPQYLYLALLALPALFLLFAWSERRRRAALARLGNPGLNGPAALKAIERLSASVNRRGRRQQRILWLAAVGLLLVALARPQWGEEVQNVERRGVQVMIALDVSKSMLAQDIKPNRLERAKLEIADLMQKLDGDSLGLVLFAGASFVQFPLTSDYGTARSFLSSARPTAISRPGTNVAEAIQTALGGFDENSAGQRVIVLITDGEAHEPGTLDAAQKAADAGAVIYTIGFGSPEGAPVPEVDFAGNVIGEKLDEAGQPVITRLDETTLQEIARIGGGAYYRAAADGSELDRLAAALGELEQGALGAQLDARRIERYQIPLAAALALLVVSWLIPDRVRARSAVQTPPVIVQPAARTGS